jgi:hypothetical protein
MLRNRRIILDRQDLTSAEDGENTEELFKMPFVGFEAEETRRNGIGATVATGAQ